MQWVNQNYVSFVTYLRTFRACVYICYELEDGSYGVRFVTAKSRVAPKKIDVVEIGTLGCSGCCKTRCNHQRRDHIIVERDTVFMTNSI